MIEKPEKFDIEKNDDDDKPCGINETDVNKTD